MYMSFNRTSFSDVYISWKHVTIPAIQVNRRRQVGHVVPEVQVRQDRPTNVQQSKDYK